MTSDAEIAPAPQPSQAPVRWGRIVFGLFAALIFAIIALILVPPASVITGFLQSKVKDATGRELKVGSSSYTIRNTVTVELRDVTLAGPDGKAGTQLFQAQGVRAELPLRSLLDRKPEIKMLALEAPVINLVRDAQGGTNWRFGAPDADTPAAAPKTGQETAQDLSAILALPVTSIRNGTVIYSDAENPNALRLDTIDARLVIDKSYGGAAAKGSARFNNEPLTFDLNVADAAAAFGGKATTTTVLIDSKVLKAKLSGEAAIGELPMLAGEIDATSPSARELANWLGFGDSVPPTLGAVSFKGRADAASGETSGAGTAVIKDQPVSYDLMLNNLRDLIQGKPTAVSGRLSASDLKADIDGSLSMGDTPAFEGKIDAQTPSIGNAASLFTTTPNSTLQSLGPGSLSGAAKINAQGVTLTDATFEADGKTGTFSGDIAVSGARPRVSGALSLVELNIDQLLGRTSGAPAASAQLEAAPAADEGFASTFDALAAEIEELEAESSPAPALSLEAKASKPVWGNTPIDLDALRSVDLDLMVTAGKVVYGALDLTQARVKTRLDNGELAASIEDLSVGKGKATGTVELKSRTSKNEAAIAIKMAGVEAEPISKELSGKALLSGASNVDIRTTASGKTLDQLVATLEGGAKFDMTKGRLRGWDIERMLNQFWNYGGWGFDPKRSTPFDKLAANYTIKAGVVRSAPDLNMTGPAAKLRSRGDVIVPKKTLNQQLDIQNLPVSIVVKGDWTQKLWIGPSFFASLSASAPSASLESATPLSAPPAMPAHVQAAVERALASPATLAKLSSAAQAFLRTLQQTSQSTPQQP